MSSDCSLTLIMLTLLKATYQMHVPPFLFVWLKMTTNNQNVVYPIVHRTYVTKNCTPQLLICSCSGVRKEKCNYINCLVYLCVIYSTSAFFADKEPNNKQSNAYMNDGVTLV